MKKIIFVLAVLMLTSCVAREDVQKKDDFLNVSVSVSDQPKAEESRIKLIDENHLGSRTFYIIEVDGHQYLSQYEGGFVHLESCKCKNQ